MRARTLLFLVLALGAAGLAALLARGMISSQQKVVASKPAAPVIVATEVLVASHPVPAGQFLKSEDLSWQVWPEGKLADGYVTKVNGSMEPFIGAVVRTGFAAGEPMTEARVAKPGDRGFLAAVLRPGMRAVAVAVNPASGVSGFVLPGDRVDVLLTYTMPSKGANQRVITATETSVEDVRVIAVDQSTNDQSMGAVLAKTVTLEATPKQAEMLNLMTQMGRVSLALRSLPTAEPQPVPASAHQVSLKPQSEKQQSEKSPPAKPRQTYTIDTEAAALLTRQGQRPTIQVVRGSKTQMEEVATTPAARGRASVPAPQADPASGVGSAEAAGTAAVARLP
jgi:pilus assembly protein CpaB